MSQGQRSVWNYGANRKAGLYRKEHNMKMKQLGTLQVSEILPWVTSEREPSASQTTCD